MKIQLQVTALANRQRRYQYEHLPALEQARKAIMQTICDAPREVLDDGSANELMEAAIALSKFLSSQPPF